MKIDSHIHLWNAEHTPQPWMTDEHEVIARPFGPADIVPVLARNDIGAVIVVQGACLDTDTDYLFAEAGRCDWIAAVTASVCLEQPERGAARLDELQARPKVRGVRHLTQGEPDYWLLREPVLESVAMLEERGLIFEIPLVFPRQFDDVTALARRFPRLRIVIDHPCSKPPIGTAEMDRWATDLGVASEHENVFAKVSGSQYRARASRTGALPTCNRA